MLNCFLSTALDTAAQGCRVEGGSEHHTRMSSVARKKWKRASRGGYGVVLVWRANIPCAGLSNSCTGVAAFGQVVILNWGLESISFIEFQLGLLKDFNTTVQIWFWF